MDSAMNTARTLGRNARSPSEIKAGEAMSALRKLVMAVNHPGKEDSHFDRVFETLRTVARKEGIAMAIVGGVAAIQHGYERFTNDVDVVIGRRDLDSIIRIAPRYGMKVIWQDPNGWHKLELEGVRIEIVPEGGKPSPHSPTTIPSPKQLGVAAGMGFASLEGWMETKLSSARRQDQADVVQILKKTSAAALNRIRKHIAGVHPKYVGLLDDLAAAAQEEKEQEKERGGPR
jgi:hypothetical protein